MNVSRARDTAKSQPPWCEDSGTRHLLALAPFVWAVRLRVGGPSRVELAGES